MSFVTLTEEEHQRLLADSKRYIWLINEGHKYTAAFSGTATMSISRGPYIIVSPPSNNQFSSIVVNAKPFADELIDRCMDQQEADIQMRIAAEEQLEKERKLYGLDPSYCKHD